MSPSPLEIVAALVKRERETLLDRWRVQVKVLPSARRLDRPTLDDHVPALIDELIAALESAPLEVSPDAYLGGSPAIHGRRRYEHDYDIVEVVAEYNLLRGCLFQLVEDNEAALRGPSFRVINGVLDKAIGMAVQTFATEQALEVQRRRDEYLSFIVHDLRTPLNAIALASDVLDETLPGRTDGERTAGMLKMLRRNVGQLQGLVDKVLKESAQIDKQAVDNLKRRETDLWLLVEALIGDLQPLSTTAGSELINQVPADLVIYADNKLLRRVFQNLLANAMKYAPRSRVTVQARPIDATGAVECRVIDDGPGIPRERLAVIFDKLETDAAHDDGVGLGLAIVKTIIEAHGGAVGCRSEQGQGTEFWLRLPGRAEDSPG